MTFARDLIANNIKNNKPEALIKSFSSAKSRLYILIIRYVKDENTKALFFLKVAIRLSDIFKSAPHEMER